MSPLDLQAIPAALIFEPPSAYFLGLTRTPTACYSNINRLHGISIASVARSFIQRIWDSTQESVRSKFSTTHSTEQLHKVQVLSWFPLTPDLQVVLTSVAVISGTAQVDAHIKSLESKHRLRLM
jgi:hypothetical protein